MCLIPVMVCQCPCHANPSMRHAFPCCDGSTIAAAEAVGGNHIAPEGKVYVCTACGKRSRDECGEQALTPGWDESCILNARLYDESQLKLDSSGRVTSITVDESVQSGGPLGTNTEL